VLDVSEVPLGAESEGAETPTSLGMGPGQRHNPRLGIWKIERLKNEERTIEPGQNVTRFQPGSHSFRRQVRMFLKLNPQHRQQDP
jgi:hypothetical protein